MKLNEISGEFELLFELPKENILLIIKHIMITDSALYTISFEDKYCEEFAREDILLTSFNRERVIYMNAQGSVKMINL
jgi:hypothetical protein